MNGNTTWSPVVLAGAPPLFALALAGCVAPGGDGGPSAGERSNEVDGAGGEAQSALRITSDRSFIFEEPGERARLEATIYRDGEPDPDAELRFRSSDPDAIAVGPDGELVAQTDLGSAAIEVSAEGARPALATAIVADLTPQTRRLGPDEIVEVEPARARATLRIEGPEPSPATGEILLGGERAGLFGRVEASSPRDGELVDVTYDPEVELTEVFENLDLDLRMAGARSAQAGAEHTPEALRCSDDPDGVLNFSRPELDPVFDPEIHFAYEISSRRVERAELAVGGDAGVDGRAGEIRIEGTFGGEFRCYVELPAIEIPPVSVLGPILEIGGGLSSRVGVEGSARFRGADAVYAGPELSAEISARAGVAYERGDGVSTVADAGIARAEATRGRWELDPAGEGDFELGVAPFVEAEIVASPRLFGGLVSLDIDLVTGSASAGADASIERPFDPYAAGYSGPRWEAFARGEIDLLPLLSDVPDFVDFFRDRLEAEVDADDVRELDPALWEGRRALTSSPRPRIAADPERIDLGEEVELTAEELGDYDAGVEYVLHRCREGLGEPVAEAPAGLPAAFTPTSDEDRGHHGVSALLWDGAAGAAGLPYAPEEPAALRVEGDAPGACGER